jgi:hypothetical protein
MVGGAVVQATKTTAKTSGVVSRKTELIFFMFGVLSESGRKFFLILPP